jgi:hypothetical protein
MQAGHHSCWHKSLKDKPDSSVSHDVANNWTSTWTKATSQLVPAGNNLVTTVVTAISPSTHNIRAPGMTQCEFCQLKQASGPRTNKNNETK